jgi:hypothetical protein
MDSSPPKTSFFYLPSFLFPVISNPIRSQARIPIVIHVFGLFMKHIEHDICIFLFFLELTSGGTLAATQASTSILTSVMQFGFWVAKNPMLDSIYMVGMRNTESSRGFPSGGLASDLFTFK